MALRRLLTLLLLSMAGCASLPDAADRAGQSVLQMVPAQWNGRPRVNRSGFGEGDWRGVYRASVVAISADRVVTALHCVENINPADVKIRLADGRTVSAAIIATSDRYDLAVLQLPVGTGLSPAETGDSSRLRIGDPVLALGFPSGLRTVSAGIVSGLQVDTDTYKGLIQTDAALNFGNSGGGLFDIRGRLVGVNTARINGLERIGLAIPINAVMEFVNANR